MPAVNLILTCCCFLSGKEDGDKSCRLVIFVDAIFQLVMAAGEGSTLEIVQGFRGGELFVRRVEVTMGLERFVFGVLVPLIGGARQNLLLLLSLWLLCWSTYSIKTNARLGDQYLIFSFKVNLVRVGSDV